MPCLFAAFEICHRSHSPLCSLFQISKPTKIQVKIAQLILSSLLDRALRLPVLAWAFTSLRSKDCKTRYRIFQFRAFELTMHVVCGQS